MRQTCFSTIYCGIIERADISIRSSRLAKRDKVSLFSPTSHKLKRKELPLRSLFRLGKLVSFLLLIQILPAVAEEKAENKRPGQTIFADNKRASLKAMRSISKSLGVKCTHCHVKEGNKVKYEIDTPNKKIARAMKLGFVDRLVTAGESSIEYTHHDEATKVRAVLQIKGEEVGIYLTKIEGGKTTAEKRIALPAKGETLNCKTCHMGNVHIFEQAVKIH